MRKLTPKQKRFADQYILTGNARQSAIKAGNSEKTASEIASENLNKPNIAAYIDNQLKEPDFDVEIRQKQRLTMLLGCCKKKKQKSMHWLLVTIWGQM